MSSPDMSAEDRCPDSVLEIQIGPVRWEVLRDCCIKANGVLAVPETREAGPASTLEKRSKPDI